jgi:hypothetical protein
MDTQGSAKNDHPSRDQVLEGVNTESIMQAVLAHQEFYPPGRMESKNLKLVDMPKFDDITHYGIDDSTEEKLWRIECERLLKTAQEPDETSRFRGNGLFGKATNDAYESLSALSDQIMCNFLICILDNELIMLEHWIKLFNKDVFRKTQGTLVSRFDLSSAIVGNRQSERLPTKLPQHNNELYFALVDYVTCIAAKILVKSAYSPFLANQTLAILSKWAAKLKYLALDPAEFAAISVGGATEFLAREQALATWSGLVLLQPESHFEDEPSKPQFSWQQSLKANTNTADFQPDMDSVTVTYFLNMVSIRKPLADVLQHMLQELRASTLSGLAANAFEMTSLVYGAGFLGRSIHLSQDRDGEIVAASLPTNIQKSFPAFQLLHKVGKAIQQERSAVQLNMPDEDDNRDCAVLQWDWRWKEPEGAMQQDKSSVIVTDMDDVISLMVPLAFTSAVVGAVETEMVSLVVLCVRGVDPPRPFPQVDLAAFFSLNTPAYQKHISRTTRLHPDVASVANSLLVHQDLVSNSLWRSNADATSGQKLRDLDHQMNSRWTVDEHSVTVNCKSYVAGVLLVSGLLISGGLATGFTLGNRLKGVDPFGIASFCWVLAGFFVLVMKSIKVENWPWKDFLYGRVVCRGVRELSANTGISPQDIITYLLHNEWSTVLYAKGPYNAPFTRQANDGFAIDEKIDLSTLLRSGFVPVKVDSDIGPALVCVDVRRNVRMKPVRHFESSQERDLRLMCLEVPSEDNQVKDCNLIRIGLGWNRVIGVYNRSGTKFR